MAAHVHLICIMAIFIPSIPANYVFGNRYDNGYLGPWGSGYSGATSRLAYGCGSNVFSNTLPNIDMNLPSTYSSELLVVNRSPSAPTGLTVQSDNSIIGDLTVAGTMPFLAAVAFDGTLLNEGRGTVSFNCGGLDIGMRTEDLNTASGYGAGYGALYRAS